MKNLLTGRSLARHRIASANRGLVRYTDTLALSKVLTPQHLRSISTEQILAGWRQEKRYERNRITTLNRSGGNTYSGNPTIPTRLSKNHFA